eukprot:1888770-Amphidinium_carterae.1
MANSGVFALAKKKLGLFEIRGCGGGSVEGVVASEGSFAMSRPFSGVEVVPYFSSYATEPGRLRPRPKLYTP